MRGVRRVAALLRGIVRLDPLATIEANAAREIATLLGQTMRHARDLARGCDPLHLEIIGLVTALVDFCANTTALFEISCKFRGRRWPAPPDAQREVHLYRIVQEAVNNAIAQPGPGDR